MKSTEVLAKGKKQEKNTEAVMAWKAGKHTNFILAFP